MLTYKSSGVDIDEGNKAVRLIKENIKTTYDKNVIGDLGNFSGMYSLGDFLTMKEPVMLASTDGVGTKLKIAQMLNKHETVGVDLVAMCVNDLICQGAKPLFFLDYIALGKLKSEHINEIVKGIAQGCRMSGCSLIGGETAEMPGMYQNEDYDLAGFSVGIADREKIISGKDVKSGDVLVGISSSGLHSNGFSLVRKLFLEVKGYKLDQYIEELNMTLGEVLLTPTQIYVKLVLDLIKRLNIKSIAHITGGGLVENVTRVIPETLGLKIDTNSWEKPGIFNIIEGFETIDKFELHKSFNMGIGLVMIVDKKDSEKLVKYVNTREVEDLTYFDNKYRDALKDKAFVIGEVVDKHKGVELC